MIHILTPDMGWAGELMAKAGKSLAENGHMIGWRDSSLYDGLDSPKSCDGILSIGYTVYGKMIDDCKKNNIPLWIISDGFLGRHGERLKNRYWAVGKNGVHAYAEQPDFLVPGDRWNKLVDEIGIKIQPWKQGGKYILVAHQYAAVPYLCIDKRPYFDEAIQQIQSVTDRPIKFRCHPLDRGRTALPEGCLESKEETFAEALEDAWAVVTYDSNAALEAVLAGVPIFTLGKSLCDAVADKDVSQIEEPARPDRQQWAHWIAYTQWRSTELFDYTAWRVLIDNEYPRVEVAAREPDVEIQSEPEPKSVNELTKEQVDELFEQPVEQSNVVSPDVAESIKNQNKTKRKTRSKSNSNTKRGRKTAIQDCYKGSNQ